MVILTHAFYRFLITLLFLVFDYYFDLFISTNMRNLKLLEQKKLMVEARVRRGEQFASKSNLPGIQTWDIKKKKMDIIKESPIVPESQLDIAPPLGESKSGSPKKMKTLMSDDVSQTDLEITTLI